MSSLNYPNLETCEVQVASSSGCNLPPPPAVDPACIEAMRAPLPTLYDFHVEKKALQPLPVSTINFSAVGTGISTPNRRKRESLERMMSITNASESECSSILQGQNHDLEASVNAYMNSH